MTMDLLNPPGRGEDQGGGGSLQGVQVVRPSHLKPGQTFAEATQVAGRGSGTMAPPHL